jgi:hypothetical protein
MSRMGHAGSRAALFYQRASEERDQAIAMALGKMTNASTKPNRSRLVPGTKSPALKVAGE